MIHAWLNSTYRLVRKTPVFLEGQVPITQSLVQAFDDPVFIEAVTHGVSLPLTVTVVGDVSEALVLTTENISVSGSSSFSSVSSVFSTVGTTGGYIELRVIGSDGNPREFEKVIESGRGYFSLQGTPVAFLGHGRIVRSEAGMIKLDGQSPVEKDLLHVLEDNIDPLAGTTYSILRARRLRGVQQLTLHQLDLQKQGREDLGINPF